MEENIKDETVEQTVDKKEAKKEAKELTKLEKAEAEITQLKMAMADLSNEKKRFEQEKQLFIKYASARVLEDLINVLDTFNMAMDTKNPSPEVKNFLFGFEMIKNQFGDLLESNGVKEIITKVGDKLDPNLHFAIDEVESDQEAGTIVSIMKRGYKHHDRLLRATMVKVAKSKEENKEETTD